MSKVSRLEVIQTGARRRWTLEEKLRIVAESSQGPQLVSATAQRHGLSVNQLFVWRRLVREGKLGGEGEGPAFIPAIVATKAVGAIGRSGPFDCSERRGRIEVVLSEPRRLIVDGDVDPMAVARLAVSLERR